MKKNIICCDIGDRLKEERERLGYLQAEFAAQGTVGRNSQSGYEVGDRPPTAEYLAKIARLGADVQYIVTGVRSENLHEIDTAESSLLRIAEDSAKYTLTTSKEIDLDLMNKVVQSIWAVLAESNEYARLTPKMFAKAVSIIYQNKKLANSQTAPKTETVRSVLDVLVHVEVDE